MAAWSRLTSVGEDTRVPVEPRSEELWLLERGENGELRLGWHSQVAYILKRIA